MDAPMLKSGEKGFDKLKPLFIIVICDYDPYGMKKYCYTFESRCKEQPDLLLGDEVTKLFLSTKGENEDVVSKRISGFPSILLRAMNMDFQKNVMKDFSKSA